MDAYGDYLSGWYDMKKAPHIQVQGNLEYR